MKLFVAIATIGRPEIVRRTVDQIGHQTRRPAGIVVVSVSPQDVGGVAESPMRPEVVFSIKGSSAQRNTAFQHLGARADVVVFLDDDFVMADDYLEALEDLLTTRTDVVGATGRLIADGINGSGYSFDEAVALVAADIPPASPQDYTAQALYGCNMAIRVAALNGLRFDERLPLYGWLEDIDLTYQLGRHGTLVKSDACAGVHMGVKGGRTSGQRFGYSQIANPIYMLRKRSAPPRLAWSNMSRNVVANIVKSFRPEPHVDRLGRLRGNLIAFGHLVTGRLDPRHILDME